MPCADHHGHSAARPVIETVILAGGQGTRLGAGVPKALAQVGGQPLLSHLLQLLTRSDLGSVSIAVGSSAGEFARALDLPCADPKSAPQHQSIELPSGLNTAVRLLQSGSDTQTGGRLARLKPLLQRTFVLCWADGLCDVDLAAMVAFHRAHGCAASVLAVHPPARFGHLRLSGDRVAEFVEKPQQPQEWINGGFFVLEPSVLDLIDGDHCSFERQVLPALAADDQLRAYRHSGYWQCMDTPAEHAELDRVASSGQRPWLAPR